MSDTIDFNELHNEYIWFHRHPELSYQETGTTERIRTILNRHGIEILDTNLPTGLIAVVRGTASETDNGKAPVIALRGDIDGLPLDEDTGLDYASVNPGITHACGHDFNLSVALGAALLLNERRDDFAGTVKIIFQPAEEVGGNSPEHPTGAVQALDTHALDDVQAFFGTHDTAALPVGVIGVRDGGTSGAVDRFSVTITGKGTHAAHPDGGTSPIPPLLAIATALQTIAGTAVDPTHPRVVAVTHVESGSTWNVIDEKAFLEGTVRTVDPEDRETIAGQVRRLVSAIGEAYDVKAELTWIDGVPAVLNSPKWTELARQAVEEVGLESCQSPATLTGEDFSYYQRQAPVVFAHVGVSSEQFPAHAIHSPRFAADPAALPGAVRFLSQLALDALDRLEAPAAGQ